MLCKLKPYWKSIDEKVFHNYDKLTRENIRKVKKVNAEGLEFYSH